MKKSNLLKTIVAGLTICSVSAMAQDTNKDKHNIDIKIPEVALLDIEAKSSTTLTFEGKAPTEAGLAIEFGTDANKDLWLNYSSIVGSKTEKSRDVTVQITSGTVPNGLSIEVAAEKDAGGGAGTVGTPAGTLTLSSAAQKIITGVGSCYTGDGTTKGHNLSYLVKLDNSKYGDLDFDQSGSVEVTYTLTDN